MPERTATTAGGHTPHEPGTTNAIDGTGSQGPRGVSGGYNRRSP